MLSTLYSKIREHLVNTSG
nr:unnamed protein product [Callosobruchus chinensis]